MKAKIFLHTIWFCFLIILSLSYKSFGQCNATYAALPYTQDFESTWLNFCGVSDVPDSSWINSYSTDITIADTTVAAWRRDDYSVWENMYYNSGEWYSPPAAHGNYSARFHTAETIDSNGISSTGNIDLHVNLNSNPGVKALSFYYINEAGSDSMIVSLSTDSGSTFTMIGHYTLTSGWTQYLLPINSNSPKAIIRFTGTSIEGYNGGDDIGLDYIQVYALPDYSVSVLTQNIVPNLIQNYVSGLPADSNYLQKNSNHIVSGELINYGGQTINTMNLKWSVNGGSVNTTTLTSLSVAPFAYYNYTSTIPWIPSSDGDQTLKIWADSINGNPDANPSTDTLTTNFVVIDSVEQKMVMLEEFGNASCDPCAYYMPNLDSVYQNSKELCNIIRYHVDWPGQDFMNDETQSQVVVRQQDLYGITSVPTVVIGGEIGISTGEISTPLIYADSYPESPLKITGTYTYDLSTHTHSITATVKSFANFPAGLNLYAVITDSLGYKKNQSQESIPQYYFPEVVEEMLPSASGYPLGEFKDDTSQSVSYTWNQTHPLAADYSTFPYDSGNFAVVIFVQNSTTNEIYQSLHIPSTEINTGINQLSSGLSKVNVYPNPFNNNINLNMNLEKNEHVIVTITDILGREVLVSDEGSLNLGEHTFMYDASSLSAGIYLLKVQTDDGLLSLKVIKSN